MSERDAIRRWEKTLDEMEAALEGQRGFAAGGEWQPPFTPPPDLGPMPFEVTERARWLLDETARVEEMLRAAVDRARVRIEMTRRLRPGTSSTPASLVDAAG